MAVKVAPASRPKMINLLRSGCFHLIDQDIDPDMDAGAHTVGGAEFGHPDEHDDAQFLGPAEIQAEQPVLYDPESATPAA